MPVSANTVVHPGFVIDFVCETLKVDRDYIRSRTTLNSVRAARAVIALCLTKHTDTNRAGIAQVIGYRSGEQITDLLDALQDGKFDEQLQIDYELVADCAFEHAEHLTQVMIEREQLIKDRQRQRKMPSPEGKKYQFTMRINKTDEEVGVETQALRGIVIVHRIDGTKKNAIDLFDTVDWWRWQKLCFEHKIATPRGIS